MAKFAVTYTIHGRATDIIEADDFESACDRVSARVESDDFDIELDDFDDVDFAVNEMHPVTRDGKEIWTTYRLLSDVIGHQSALLESPLFAEAAGKPAAEGV